MFTGSRCQESNVTLPWPTLLGPQALVLLLRDRHLPNPSFHWSYRPLVTRLLVPMTPTEMDYNTTYGATSTAPAAPFIPDNTDDERAPIPADPAGMKRLPKHQLTFTVCEWNGGTHSDLQVAEHNLETNSFREHQVEFFFYKFAGDWHTAQKMSNYWRQHYGLDTLPMDPVSAPDPPAGVLPDLTTLDPATVYAAQLMTVFRSLPPAASPDQKQSQLVTLVQDSEVRNMFTPIDLNTLATQIHQLADLLSEANALPMEVHLTPTDASLL
eukprot:s2810_g5.t1